MKTYSITFSFLGQKKQMTILSQSKEEALRQFKEKLKIHSIIELWDHELF